jgi:hypothetical protein
MLMQLIAKLFLENKIPVAIHAQKLEASGAKVLERFDRAGDSDVARKTLVHIVAIERWGTNRLRVLAGEKTFVRDENHAYKPDINASWPALLEALRTTRADLIALAPKLEGKTAKVAHNMMGELSAAAWLRYLESHANLESGRVKPKR